MDHGGSGGTEEPAVPSNAGMHAVTQVPDGANTLLTEVSSLLAEERDPGKAIDLVLRRLIPEVADWGMARLGESGGIRQVAGVHADPTKATVIETLLGFEPFGAHSGSRTADDRTGPLTNEHHGEVFHNIDREALDRLEPDPGVQRVWRDLGLEHVAIVPLVAGSRVVGTFLLVMGDSGRSFDLGQIALVEQVAVQCALLVENASLIRESRAATSERVNVRSLLDTVLSNAPVATAIVDTGLRILHVNDAFATLATSAGTGVPLAEALPDLARSIVPAATDALTAGTMLDRTVVRSTSHPGVPRRYWELSAFPIDRSPGERLGVGLFLSDITDERMVARRLKESLARLDLSLAAGGLASWDWDFFGQQILWAGTPSESLGLPVEAFGSDPEAFLAIMQPDDREEYRTLVIDAARAARDVQTEVRVVRPDGEVRWMEIRGRVITDSRGDPRRMIGVLADITDRRLIDDIKARLLDREHQARVDAEEARERLAFVAEVSAAMTSTLDPRAAYEQIPDLVVPRVCDWCVVDALDDDGHLVEVAIAHRDPAQVEDVRESRRLRQVGGGDGIWSVRRTVRQAASELVLDIGDDDLVAVAVDDDHLRLLRSLAPRSAIVAPLMARGRVLGGLTMVVSHDRRFVRDDLTLVENIAARAAMAVDNALLFESRTQVTRALQQTLLPPALPSVPHLDLVARYRVAQGGIDIGGDFYDLFKLGDGSWAVVIGDVCGKGPEAAAVTGLFRHTLRAVAMTEHSPARVLRGTNDAILGQIDDTRFCTAAVVRLDATAGWAKATIACGGHPRPLVVRAGGTVEPVEVSGTLLGVLPEPVLSEVQIELGVGDAIVLYTDGVTEARRDQDLFGEARLMGVLESAVRTGVATSAGLADTIVDAVDRYQRGVANDDTAILVVRVDDPAVPPTA